MFDENQLSLEQDLLRIRMDESRDALVQKIELLEEKVAETVENATATVAEATASVMETVQNASASVSETVDSVTDAVQGTVDTVRNSFEETVGTVKEAFDWRSHVERHPVLAVAGAVAVGFLVANVLQPSTPAQPKKKIKKLQSDVESQRSREAFHRNEQSLGAVQVDQTNDYHSNGEQQTNGIAATNRTTTNASAVEARPAVRSDWLTSLGTILGPEVEKLQSLVVGTALGSLRDLIIHDVPEPIQLPLAGIIDSVTEKLGGTCTHSALTSTHDVRN